MSYDVPHRYESQIELMAQAQHITTDEAIDQIIQAGLERFASFEGQPKVSNASLFGAVKGRGAHGSKEAIGRYLEDLRAEW